MGNNGRCSLIINGEELDYEYIDKLLPIKPVEIGRKGERIEKWSKILRNNDTWQYSFEFKDSSPEIVIEKLLNEIELYKDNVDELSKKYEVYIRLYIQDDEAQIYFLISKEILKKISELNIDFGISILSWGEAKV